MDKTSVLTRAALALVVISVLFAGAAVAATSGTIHKKTALRTKPYSDAPVRMTLASGTKVAVLERKSGWMLVKSGIRTGWVRMLDVRTVSVGSATSVSVIGKGAVELATGRTGTGNIVATSGVRGLDEESLANAGANPEQFAKLTGLAASASVAKAYARKVGLKTRQVADLPVPGGQQ
jgi:uncharacterized protein YgiM (DUF1202 family)